MLCRRLSSRTGIIIIRHCCGVFELFQQVLAGFHAVGDCVDGGAIHNRQGLEGGRDTRLIRREVHESVTALCIFSLCKKCSGELQAYCSVQQTKLSNPKKRKTFFKETLRWLTSSQTIFFMDTSITLLYWSNTVCSVSSVTNFCI